MTTIICILGGLLLIYRAHQTINDFDKFNWTVTNLTINKFLSHKSGYRYSLDFSFAETKEVFGIYLGTKEQANNNDLKNKIEIGKDYTFYIDKTVASSFEKHTLGIREIRNSKVTIYKDNQKANYIGGFILILMGIGTLLIFIYAGKRKKNAQ
jgi:hypothetical protein